MFLFEKANKIKKYIQMLMFFLRNNAKKNVPTTKKNRKTSFAIFLLNLYKLLILS